MKAVQSKVEPIGWEAVEVHLRAAVERGRVVIHRFETPAAYAALSLITQALAAVATVADQEAIAAGGSIVDRIAADRDGRSTP